MPKGNSEVCPTFFTFVSFFFFLKAFYYDGTQIENWGQVRAIGNFAIEEVGSKNLMRGGFDYTNLFQS